MSKAVYGITAICPDGEVSATRGLRASAVVLAMKWQASGLQNVNIKEPTGEIYELVVFRKTRVPSVTAYANR